MRIGEEYFPRIGKAQDLSAVCRQEHTEQRLSDGDRNLPGGIHRRGRDADRRQKAQTWIYWIAILASTTVGTTMADFADRVLGIGYAAGSSILVALLLLSLAVWRWTEGTVSSTRSPRLGLKPSTGRRSCSPAHRHGARRLDGRHNALGFGGGALVFAFPIVLMALLYYAPTFRELCCSQPPSSWMRPLGARVGDLLDKPHASEGMGLSRIYGSAVSIVSFRR
jgi:uncharacterized membrane-anchored protein